jgi:hypothetical protein
MSTGPFMPSITAAFFSDQTKRSMKHAAPSLFQACKRSSRPDVGAIASIEHELTGSGRDFSIEQRSAYSGGSNAE